MTFCSNQLNGRCVASVLTAVGALRVSIGPPIMVSVFGRHGFLSSFISAVAAKAGTAGWHTASKCGRSPVLADQLEELDQIIDIVVEVEAAVRQRHQLRIAPVGDVDVAAREQALDRPAQQRRIVARHRRDDQQARTLVDAFAGEMLELPERLAENDLLVDAHVLAADPDAVDAEFRLAARRGGMGEDLEARGDHRPHRAVTPGIGGIVEPAGAEPASLLAPARKERWTS